MVQATSNGFTISKMFDAPRELVFTAWTDPGLFSQWFGTREAIVPHETIEMDLRPGGSWSAGMILQDGAETTWRGTYREVDPPARLVFTMTDQPSASPADTVSVDLIDASGKTEMTMTVTGANSSADDFEEAREAWLAYLADMADLLT
jgi:uncharacterized protein YndB with AHSA1/START domain